MFVYGDVGPPCLHCRYKCFRSFVCSVFAYVGGNTIVLHDVGGMLLAKDPSWSNCSQMLQILQKTMLDVLAPADEGCREAFGRFYKEL